MSTLFDIVTDNALRDLREAQERVDKLREALEKTREALDDEDRRADRVRIAELERDLNTIRGDAGLVNDALGILDLVQAPEAIADLTKQLDELTEKCAALVVENKRLAEHAGKWVNVETPAVEVKRTPKVGDRVRIIKQIEHRDYGVAGEIGTVIGFDGDDVDVKGVGRNGGPWFHSPENLEVIE